MLSPSNKEEGEPRLAWKRKRLDYLRGGISLVEIDLLRGGGWALPDRSLLKPVPPGRVYHHVCVTRPPWLTRHEFYVLPLRQRLPAIRVPLRRTDLDAALDLQVLIDQCYERGRYGSAIDYSKPPQLHCPMKKRLGPGRPCPPRAPEPLPRAIESGGGRSRKRLLQTSNLALRECSQDPAATHQPPASLVIARG